MNSLKIVASIVCSCVVFGLQTSSAQEPSNAQTHTNQKKQGQEQQFLESLAGQWEGTCKTWFRPGQLADESKVEGEIKPLLGGPFLRHTYKGQMKGRERIGEETIVFNTLEDRFEVSWIDSFHMKGGILFSVGEMAEGRFSVKGQYSAGPGQKPWGWRTEYELDGKEKLTITAYNILPSGEEAKAVETVYIRKK